MPRLEAGALDGENAPAQVSSVSLQCPAGGAGAAIERALLRRGGIREDRNATPRVPPDKLTTHLNPRRAPAPTARTGVSRGWSVLSMDRTLATGFTTGRHAQCTCFVLYPLRTLRSRKIEQDKNKSSAICNTSATPPPERGPTLSIKRNETEPYFPEQPDAWPELSMVKLPRSPINPSRMLKSWTIQAYFLEDECRFGPWCGPKALTSNPRLRYTKPSPY